ncbi:MAG: hypothetical protein VKP57_11885 [Candidatus Sericytochromatia bacterium]|nr:hypothetical protein [Candidatus Sericytochromatia bacterium]
MGHARFAALAMVLAGLVGASCAVPDTSLPAAQDKQPAVPAGSASAVSLRLAQQLPDKAAHLWVLLVDTTASGGLQPSLGVNWVLGGEPTVGRSMDSEVWAAVLPQVASLTGLSSDEANRVDRVASAYLGRPDRHELELRFRNLPKGQSNLKLVGLVLDGQQALVASGVLDWPDPAVAPASPLMLQIGSVAGDPALALHLTAPPHTTRDLYVGVLDLADMPQAGDRFAAGSNAQSVTAAAPTFMRALQEHMIREGVSPLRANGLRRWHIRKFPGGGRNRHRQVSVTGVPAGPCRVFAVWERPGDVHTWDSVALTAGNRKVVTLDGDSARLAPDDPGDPLQQHLHEFVIGGVASPFVWVPRFEAWQLINPANCGAPYASTARGTWVASQPSAGQEDGDWARETFGGFYIAQYEASHADALPGDALTGAGAVEGSASGLKIAAMCPPWANVSRAAAAAACAAYMPQAHLLRDDEYTALAVWAATRNGGRVHGHNYPGRDADNANTTFIDDPTDAGSRALTGSGSNGAWSAGINLTSHDGTSAGVHDLIGNVAEWTQGVSFTSGANLVVEGILLGPMVTAWVTELDVRPDRRRYGVPGAVGSSPVDSPFPAIVNGNVNGNAWIRGGAVGEMRRSLWDAELVDAGTHVSATTGFRPAVRF